MMGNPCIESQGTAAVGGRRLEVVVGDGQRIGCGMAVDVVETDQVMSVLEPGSVSRAALKKGPSRTNWPICVSHKECP